MDGLLKKREDFDDLRDRLATCPVVAQYGPDEPGTLVHAFSDIEDSCRTFLNEQLPKLVDSTVQKEQFAPFATDVGHQSTQV